MLILGAAVQSNECLHGSIQQ